MNLSILKGTKDYYPQEQIARERILRIFSKYFSLYGYQPLETPILNYFEVLASKYAGGAEILKETYQLTDQGERELGLRYDLTVPFARFIGMNPTLSLPFKRYEFGKVFRNGPVKTGRAREFTQCDVDICGTSSMIADAELLVLAKQIFKELGIEIFIEINNRKLLSGLIQLSGAVPEQFSDIILSLDKLKKIGAGGVKKELQFKKIDLAGLDQILNLLDFHGTCTEIMAHIKKHFEINLLIEEGLNEINELLKYLQAAHVDEELFSLNPTLARGLEIYTGTVFEIFAKNSKISSSIAAGGRYDHIIGSFLNSKTKDAYPAVGICFGLDVIYAVLQDHHTLANYPYELFIIPMSTELKSFDILTEIRRRGISANIQMKNAKLKKSLAYANKQKVPFVLIIGEDELKENLFTLKSMNTSEEFKLPLDEVVEKIKIMKKYEN